MYRLRVPEWEDRSGNTHSERNLIVELVDTLWGGIEPAHDSVFKYYGIPPRSAFKAIEADRLVFWNEDAGYIIVPDVPSNKGLWQELP